jgi:hypothetical protein
MSLGSSALIRGETEERIEMSKSFSTGVVVAVYERAGDIVPGSFALEEPTEAEIARREGLKDR